MYIRDAQKTMFKNNNNKKKKKQCQCCENIFGSSTT